MKRIAFLLLLTGLVGALACGGGSEDGADGDNGKGGKADENGGDFPCEVEHFRGGAIDLSQRTDVLAEKVLKNGDGCPTDFAAVMEKLRQTDSEKCSTETRTSGINSMVVSETAQLLGEPTGYRIVTTRKCGDRDQEDLFFSLFGVSPVEKDEEGKFTGNLPRGAEVMAFDEAKQEYAYYEITNGGKWEFFGTSTDILTGEAGRCASCHTGGGPIMKELDTPWLHWEGHEDVPGAKDLVDAFDDLGSKASGSRMEGLTKSGNRKWNKTRVELLKSTGDTSRLLEPLFCTVEVNIDNGTDFAGRELGRVNLDFMLDPQLAGFGGIDVNHEDYVALRDEFEQFVDLGGQNAQDAEGKEIRDTIFLFAYPERSFADNDYVTKLKDAGIVDDEFIKDVLAVDFTNPIWSDARCDLLQFAPEVEEFTPDTLREGFLAKLADAEGGTPAAALKANLEEKENQQAHKDAVTAFTDACKARDKREFLEDIMIVVTAHRDQARALHVFEFDPSLPKSTFSVDPSVHLDPVTCELVQPE